MGGKKFLSLIGVGDLPNYHLIPIQTLAISVVMEKVGIAGGLKLTSNRESGFQCALCPKCDNGPKIHLFF